MPGCCTAFSGWRPKAGPQPNPNSGSAPLRRLADGCQSAGTGASNLRRELVAAGEAQQAAIAQFAKPYHYRVAETFMRSRQQRAPMRQPARLAAAIKVARRLANGGRSKVAPVIVESSIARAATCTCALSAGR